MFTLDSAIRKLKKENEQNIINLEQNLLNCLSLQNIPLQFNDICVHATLSRTWRRHSDAQSRLPSSVSKENSTLSASRKVYANKFVWMTK